MTRSGCSSISGSNKEEEQQEEEEEQQQEEQEEQQEEQQELEEQEEDKEEDTEEDKKEDKEEDKEESGRNHLVEAGGPVELVDRGALHQGDRHRACPTARQRRCFREERRCSGRGQSGSTKRAQHEKVESVSLSTRVPSMLDAMPEDHSQVKKPIARAVSEHTLVAALGEVGVDGELVGDEACDTATLSRVDLLESMRTAAARPS